MGCFPISCQMLLVGILAVSLCGYWFWCFTEGGFFLFLFYFFFFIFSELCRSLNCTEEVILELNGSTGNRKPPRKERKKLLTAYASILLKWKILHGFKWQASWCLRQLFSYDNIFFFIFFPEMKNTLISGAI